MGGSEEEELEEIWSKGATEANQTRDPAPGKPTERLGCKNPNLK